MPQANQRRGAVAARTVRPDQQRKKKALAAFDFLLMGTGRACVRCGEHRERPASGGSASRETRQAVFDQAEIDQRDRRALPDLRNPGGMECAKSAAFRDGAHDVALQIAIIEETVEPALVGPGSSGADRAAVVFQRRFEIAEPRRWIVAPGVPPGKPHPGAGQKRVRGHDGRREMCPGFRRDNGLGENVGSKPLRIYRSA